jgi:hypothetical protein
MTSIQYAWAFYIAGSLGCCIAAWWIFLWAWRFVRYSVVVTVAVILFTPYAIDSQTMQMAPALYTLLFEGMASGMESIKPLVKLMVALWLISIILVLVYVILTRRQFQQEDFSEYAQLPNRNIKKADNKTNFPPMASLYSNDQSENEHRLTEDRLTEEPSTNETPIRALRD